MGKRKKGDIPGRYVHAHVRHAPNCPNEYVNVKEYQEQIEPPPSPAAHTNRQLDLALSIDGNAGDDAERNG